jgi:hypothetical protein
LFAGALKRSNKNFHEETILICFMKDFNSQKIMSKDVEVCIHEVY